MNKYILVFLLLSPANSFAQQPAGFPGVDTMPIGQYKNLNPVNPNTFTVTQPYTAPAAPGLTDSSNAFSSCPSGYTLSGGLCASNSLNNNTPIDFNPTNGPAVQKCAAAARTAVTECATSGGIGSAAAGMLQQQVGNALAQEQANAAMQPATVVNVYNQQGNQNNANSACNSVKDLAGANLMAGLLESTFCYRAHSACYNACTPDSTPAGQQQQKLQNTCDQALQMFQAQIIPQALNAAMVAATGAGCNNATTTAAAGNPLPLPVAPTLPPYGEPAPPGLAPFAAGTPGGASFPPDGGSGGGSALGNAGYPGGQDNKNGQGKDAATVADHALGLSNGGGGGGGWPTGVAGGGGGQNGKGEGGIDLRDFLPCLDKKDPKCQDPSRNPAGVTEVTGANDLTNFQKVTRAMSKKRPILKSGDGA